MSSARGNKYRRITHILPMGTIKATSPETSCSIPYANINSVRSMIENTNWAATIIVKSISSIAL